MKKAFAGDFIRKFTESKTFEVYCKVCVDMGTFTTQNALRLMLNTADYLDIDLIGLNDIDYETMFEDAYNSIVESL